MKEDSINGYNNAAGLLADKNHFSGIDIVKFGENINIIQKSATFEKNLNLTEDEKTIYKILSRTMQKSISEIAPYAPFGTSKTTQLLKNMGQKGVIKVEYRGSGTKYIIICEI